MTVATSRRHQYSCNWISNMAVQYRIGWEVAKDKLLNSQIERDNTNLTYAWKKKEKAVKKRKKLLLLLCYFLETLLPLLGPDP